MKNEIKLSKDECEVIVGLYGEFDPEQMIKWLDISEDNQTEENINNIISSLLEKFGVNLKTQVIAEVTSKCPKLWEAPSLKLAAEKLFKIYG